MADDIDALLKAWGLYYGERSRVRYTGSGGAPDVHPLARAQQFAPGKKDKRIATERAGYARRRYMAQALEALNIIPAGFVDPVPCKETRSFRLVHEHPVPPTITRVETAAKELEAADLLRGLCLRARYCIDGTDTDRALWATLELRKSSHYAQDISTATMRAEAAFARAWMAGRLGVAMLRATPLPPAR